MFNPLNYARPMDDVVMAADDREDIAPSPEEAALLYEGEVQDREAYEAQMYPVDFTAYDFGDLSY